MNQPQRYLLYVAGSLTLGLAPFVPMPQLFRKLAILFGDMLCRPADGIDLALH